MEDFIIHPDHRSQGFGSRLINHVVEFAESRDFLRITLLTDKMSDKSQEFFMDHGFQFSHMIPMRRVLSRGDA